MLLEICQEQAEISLQDLQEVAVALQQTFDDFVKIMDFTTFLTEQAQRQQREINESMFETNQQKLMLKDLQEKEQQIFKDWR